MEYLALYRKYRPKKLDEVVGQTEIKKILASSVKNGTITHAYLFSGPRGTGKTTMAKILAKMVNCLDPIDGNACNKCDSCLNILDSNDVIEIDAASNNGVDEIRELREKANLVPNSAKYKVYIIDEVHMLTTQAFNALLKTLEEPPKHVIFILATTEYYKIPLTITSRCQKFQFNKITSVDIITKLREISDLEKIKIDEDALVEIAKISDGGMRDAINFLDQLRSFTSKKITVSDVYEVCGNISNVEIVELLGNIKLNNCEKVTEFFENMSSSGKNYGKFLEGIVEFLKDVILYKQNVSGKYIKSEIDAVKKVSSLYSDVEIFYIVECLNDLFDKLKNVSKQSVLVTTNFLIIMNKLADNIEFNGVNVIEKKGVNNKKESIEKNYDMAFQFTSIENKKEENLTDNDISSDDSIPIEDNVTNISNVNKNKEIIINNAFAVADKKVKISLQNCMSKLGNYLTDKKFKVAAGTLADVKLEVAGKGYIILSAMNDAIVDKVYDNYKLCYELLAVVFEDEYNFAILNQNEWNQWRDKYMDDFKKGKKYTLKELEKEQISEKKKKNEPTVVDKLFDLVGEEIIEFK